MGKTVLLADDSPTIRRIVELTFSDSSVRVESAGSCEQVLARLESACPDLILADVSLGEGGGYRLCSELKAAHEDLPVLLLAGTFEPFDTGRAEECGADGYLIKPFESDELRRRVEQLLQGESPEAPAVTAAERAVDAPAVRLEPEPAPAPAPTSREPEDPPADVEAAPAGEPTVETTDDPSPELVEAVARAVVGRLSEDAVREIAREIVPEIAGKIIRERIVEIENEAD
ncbi:MAG: response regulator [bacterium]|nr:response regulator [bacterium]